MDTTYNIFLHENLKYGYKYQYYTPTAEKEVKRLSEYKYRNRRHRHTYVNLPNEVVDQVDLVVEKRTDGYGSRAEFVRDAVREKLRFYHRRQ